MKTVRILTILIIALILATCVSQTALAVVIRVNNPGFEDNKPASGGSTPSANGWFISGTAGTFYPNAAAFADLAPQGNNVAYADVGTLSQTTTEIIQGNTVYSLIVEVGDRLNTAFVSYAVKLYAGGTLMTSVNSPIPTNGSFVTAVVNYDVQLGDPVIGNILTVELSSGGVQGNFDSVRLVKLTDPILNLNQGTQFASIQAAIYGANNGDVVEVPPGTYYEHINFVGKKITLRSRSGDPNDTIVDGRFIDMSSGSPVLSDLKGSVITCTAGEDVNAIIEGFTITKGNGFLFAASDRRGGGMHNKSSNPVVRNCIFASNTAVRGGAIFNEVAASGTFDNCQFIGNSVTNRGGGIYNNASHPVISHCLFWQNLAQPAGGGIYNESVSNPQITDCVFTLNTGTTDGGGIYNNTGTPIITRCDFNSNQATFGGALYNYNSPAVVIDCNFTSNWGVTQGGAVMNYSSSNPSLTGCTFKHNTSADGGAIMNRSSSSPVILDCTFEHNSATNTGGAVNSYEGTNNPIIAYSRFSGNRANNSGGGAIINSGAGNFRLNHCLFVGNYAKTYGGGFYTGAGTTDIQHCSFTSNNAGTRGGGIFLITAGTVLNIINTIAWGNISPTGADLRQDSGTLAASYDDFGASISGAGNLVVDPNFTVTPSDGGDGWGDNPSTASVDESINDNFGDLHLLAGSLCIDAGNSLFTSAVDLDRNVRAVNDPDKSDTGIGPVTFLDMGAYEFGSLPPVSGIPGDLNSDGVVNFKDLAILANHWLEGL